MQGTVFTVGSGGDVRDELRDVGPDAGFDAGAEFDGNATDERGGGAEFEARANADAEDGGEDEIGADEGYGEKLEVAAVAGGVVG